MNILIWSLQGTIALLMVMAGVFKLVKSKAELKKEGNGRMDWTDDVSSSNLKLIGVLELLAGIGLILPQLLGILPWLTPLAAVGVVLTMVGAINLHVRRKDGAQAIITSLVILSIAAFVAYGRFVVIPA